MSTLAGKRVIVTGAAQGMGRAIAVECARLGAEAVTVVDLSEAGAQETASLVEAAGARASAVLADLTDPAQIEALVDDAVAFGGGLDTVFNNAGVIDSAFVDQPGLLGTDLPTWDLVFAVNVRAPWLLMRAASAHLLASERGPSVVNAASVAAVNGAQDAVAYAASKAALVNLTKSAAIALAPTVRVNAYLPGVIATPMALGFLDAAEDRDYRERHMTGAQLLPRLGDPAEVAQVACFLASDAASFVTGGVYEVDGGMLAWRGLRA